MANKKMAFTRVCYESVLLKPDRYFLDVWFSEINSFLKIGDGVADFN